MKIYLLNPDRSSADEFTLREPQTRLGREEDNDVQLLVAGVSRYHCIFEHDGFEWRVRDLGSTNGTKVNHHAVANATALRPGDLIDVGDQLIRFGESPSAVTTTVPDQISIFDHPEPTAPQPTPPHAQVVVPSENEREDLTKTVIESPIPILSPMPAQLAEDTPAPAPQVIIPGEQPETPPEMTATSIIGNGGNPVFTQYSTTATVRTPIPPFDPATMQQEDAKASPMVIINLPSQDPHAGNIILEPLPHAVPDQVIPPPSVVPATPAPILTPAPETMTGPAPGTPAAPLQQQTVSPAAEKPTAEPDKTLDINLFNKIPLFDAKPSAGARKTPDAATVEKPKRKVSNLLFYTTVICIAMVLASLFIMMKQNGQSRTAAGPAALKEPEYPLLLVYEKRIITANNIFMFTMSLENTGVTLTLDDLKSQRRYIREDAKVNPDLIADLLSSIKSTDFMDLKQQTPGTPRNGTDEYRRLTIGYNNRLQTIVVENNFAPSSFEKIEQAINDFADGYGLQTIALTPAELKREAETAFNKAEELFQNRDSDPQNLTKAIKRYQLTVEYLDQFAPKPRQWDLARKRIEEAKDIRAKRLQDLKFDYQRQYKLQEYEEMLRTLSQILPLLDPGSKEYDKYKNFQVRLEAKIKQGAKR